VARFFKEKSKTLADCEWPIIWQGSRYKVILKEINDLSCLLLDLGLTEELLMRLFSK